MALGVSQGFIRIQLDSHSLVAGDQLTGSINLHITTPAPTYQLVLKFTGKEVYSYMESRRERNWSGNYVTNKYPKSINSPLIKQVFPVAAFPAHVIPPGQYSYPFMIRTPSNLLPSLLLDRGETRAEVRYRLVAKADRNTWVQKAKSALTVTRELNPVEGVRALQIRPARLKSMCCFDRGTVSVSATLDKDAYFPGDLMVVSLKVDNKDSGLRVVACKANIYREIYLKDHIGNRNLTEERVNSASVPADIPAGKSLLSVQTVEIPIRVVESSGKAFTAPTVSAKLMGCAYRVEAEAEMAGWFMCCGQRAKAILAFSVFKRPFREDRQGEIAQNWSPEVFPVLSFEAGPQFQR